MNITNLNDQLARKFSGSSLDDIQGLTDFSIYREAAGNLLAELDPQETVRYHRFNQFGGVYDYEAPDDLKAKKIIDPRPQSDRAGRDVRQVYIKDFDRDKEFDDDKASVEFMDGLKVIRLNDRGRVAARVDSTQDDSDWAAAGGATGLALDAIQRLEGSNSLGFDLGAAGGYIENDSLSPVNLSEHAEVASLFRLVYLPAVSQLTSISLRIGNDSGAYWTLTGEPHLGAYKVGINLVRFDWYGAAETGAPDPDEFVEYERLIFATTSALAGVRVGPLTSRLPTPWETPYYSTCLFMSAAGTWLDTPTADSDEIVLELDGQNIFFYEVCVLVAEDLSMDEEAEKFRKKLDGTDKRPGLYARYKEDKPTEKLRSSTRYIRLTGRRNRMGRRRR